jgi:hypothetical protein
MSDWSIYNANISKQSEGERTDVSSFLNSKRKNFKTQSRICLDLLRTTDFSGTGIWTHMQMIDPKDKCMHKIKHDPIHIWQ